MLYIRTQAMWFEPEFKKLLSKIVEDLNTCADKCEEDPKNSARHIADLGLDPKIYKLKIIKQLHQPLDLTQTETNGGTQVKGHVCGVIIPPVKSAESATRKAIANHSKGWVEVLPAARYLCDYLRATICAQDPYVLAFGFF